MTTKLQAYEAALKSAAYFYQPNAGFLRLSGADRVDFLQRQTTNDLRQLAADHSISTVLTSPTARILDVFCIIDEGESLGVISLSGRFGETSEFLRSRIFFSDQVSVDDLSREYAQILLFGPHKDGVLEKLNLRSLASGDVAKYEIADQSITVIGQKILADIGFRFLATVSAMDVVLTELDGSGAVSLNSEVFETLRVEAGQPGPVGELVETYTPLEVQLQDMISDSKGCYTGQEIIARQITYDKVAKNLVGIRLSGPVDIGAKVEVEGKSAGTLTSVVQSPRFGEIGLGIVRRQFREPGTRVSILGKDGSTTDGEVVELPFR